MQSLNAKTRVPTRLARSRADRKVCRVVAHASQPSTRRDVLLAGAALAASPLIIVQRADANLLTDGKLEKAYLEVKDLSTIYRNLQRNEFIARAQLALREVLTAEDAPACVALAIRDAATYDAVTKTGGFDGSIATNQEELNRPENAGLKAAVAKLAEAKAKIDAGFTEGGGPISWADTIYLGGKVATQKAWLKAKLAANPNSGELIASAFPNPWPIEIGRIDNAAPGPKSAPASDADVQTIRAFLNTVGQKPGAGSGPFDPKPLLWEKPGFLLWTATAADSAAEEARFAAADPIYAQYKKTYDKSRKSVTRTDYEVDFANAYNRLATIGAKFDKNAYLHRVEVKSLG